MNYPAQQYGQPQYPQPPAQQFPQAPPVAQQPYPAQQFPQAPQQYAAPQYPAPQAPAQPPAPPLATGSLDDYFNQPSAASGPSISWTDGQGQPKPVGTTYVGIVARDVTNADIQQQTDFNTKAPLFYRDGRPKFAMKVPLKVQPSQEFPEGEATWYVKGQARDELVRAMAEAGVDGAPRGGAAISITLVQRRPSGKGMNPANVVQVKYQPGQGAAAPAQPPAQQVPTPQAAPAEQPQQWAQPAAPAQPAPEQQFQQTQVAQPVQQQPAPQAPAQPAAPQGVAMPADFNAEQQALLARITGQQGGQPAA